MPQPPSSNGPLLPPRRKKKLRGHASTTPPPRPTERTLLKQPTKAPSRSLLQRPLTLAGLVGCGLLFIVICVLLGQHFLILEKRLRNMNPALPAHFATLKTECETWLDNRCWGRNVGEHCLRCKAALHAADEFRGRINPENMRRLYRRMHELGFDQPPLVNPHVHIPPSWVEHLLRTRLLD